MEHSKNFKKVKDYYDDKLWDERIENMFRGWMGAHYKLLSKQQRKNLIQLYEELFNKKISVISRKLIVSDASSLAA